MASERDRLKPKPVICPYCGTTAELVSGTAVYPARADLSDRSFWRCPRCPDAYVGCHPGTTQPLGRLANAELRRAKQAAHKAFDPLWKAKMERDGCSKKVARGAAYQWLADALGIERADCHIGMMDVETCRRTADACRRYLPAVTAVRVRAAQQRRESA